MPGVNDMNITLYLVGEDEDEAQQNLLFDSQESAEDYAHDYPGSNVYSVSAVVDFTTIELVKADADFEPPNPQPHLEAAHNPRDTQDIRDAGRPGL